MSDFLRHIFAEVVGAARDEMSNNGCNDYPVKVNDENREDVRALCVEYAQDDDELESLLEQLGEGKVYFQDWCILDMLINRLRENKL